jgi:RNA polymerase II subunit A small phosphatase-like protein
MGEDVCYSIDEFNGMTSVEKKFVNDDTKGNRINKLSPRTTLYCLLPPLLIKSPYKRTLVLDLDETLVFSSFIPIPDPTKIIPVVLNGIIFRVFVKFRPFAKELISSLTRFYEIVIFTASIEEVSTFFKFIFFEE